MIIHGNTQEISLSKVPRQVFNHGMIHKKPPSQREVGRVDGTVLSCILQSICIMKIILIIKNLLFNNQVTNIILSRSQVFNYYSLC